MSMKFLFLDIDGVLNTTASLKVKLVCDFHSNIFAGKPLTRAGFNFVDDCLANLKRILEEVQDLTLVISSNWRYHVQPRNFYELFALFDIHPEKIHMIGPQQETTFYKRSFIISEYLKDIIDDGIRYIAVDDRNDLYHSEFTNVIITDPSTGLTKDIANAIIKHLND